MPDKFVFSLKSNRKSVYIDGFLFANVYSLKIQYRVYFLTWMNEHNRPGLFKQRHFDFTAPFLNCFGHD